MEQKTVLDDNKPTCGIVMPISAIDGCDESHWSEVLDIMSDAITDAGFEPNVVSNADDIGIIHKRIIQNLYDNPIVVCDISGKNANVMFELGLRLAFDKPTIIVKDEKTAYSFDTAVIEHLEYPRDLRFSRIVEFKEKLSEKIQATYQKATSDTSYTTFLKHFGEFRVAKLDKKEVSGQDYIVEELRSLRTAVDRMETRASVRASTSDRFSNRRRSSDLEICLKGRTQEEISHLQAVAADNSEVRGFTLEKHGDHRHLLIDAKPGTQIDKLEVALFGAALTSEPANAKRLLKKRAASG